MVQSCPFFEKLYFSSGNFRCFVSCLLFLILSSFLLGIASIGLAAAYYSAGNGLSLFWESCLFPVDLFFMLMTHLQLLSGPSKAVEVPLPLGGVNIKPIITVASMASCALMFYFLLSFLFYLQVVLIMILVLCGILYFQCFINVISWSSQLSWEDM